MKLLDIVETKFLPPLCNKKRGAGKNPFSFIVKEIEGMFFPAIQDKNYGSSNTFFFQNNGSAASRNTFEENQPNNGAVKFYSLEKATKACWEYYRERDYFRPAHGAEQ